MDYRKSMTMKDCCSTFSADYLDKRRMYAMLTKKKLIVDGTYILHNLKQQMTRKGRKNDQ